MNFTRRDSEAMSQRMKNYCIISHTHWDREWYLPFEKFRVRLVDLIDNLLDILEKDRGYRFHLDAQTIVLEDYLKIKPQKEKLLKKHIKNGRILVGPWYVQNDFHLVSGEATVRNLLIGMKIANDFGKCMMIGYAADQFGLCSQLPQILSGTGLDTCIFGRGFGRTSDTQFYWESPDGSRILCEHMFAWYNNLQRLPQNAAASVRLIRERGGRCSERAVGSGCLLMNGVDHLEAQEDLTKIIKKVRPLLNEDETLIQDTMPEYMQRLKDEIAEKGLSLVTHKGEMRDNGQGNVLTGTLSSRVYLKQANARLQGLIEGRFEPAYSVLGVLGIKKYPLEYSTFLWKWLIENHPHDSICGCSDDAVHIHMMDRFKSIGENLTELNFRADEAYMQHIDRTIAPANAVFIMCVNNSLCDFNGVVTAQLELLSASDTGGFAITDEKGRAIPFEVVKIERNVQKRTLSPINLPGIQDVNRYTLRLRPGKIKPMTRKVLVCIPNEKRIDKVKLTRRNENVLENEHLNVLINQNGTVDLTHKASGRVYRNLLLIEDSEDVGDLYIYKKGDLSCDMTSGNIEARIEITAYSKLYKAAKISYTLKRTRRGETEELPVEIFVSLSAGSEKLDVSVTLDNKLKNHRTRVLLPTGIASEENYAGQPFDIIKRPKVSPFANDETHPNTNFVGIDGEGAGIAILNEGLYEYEHMTDEKSTLALTLLRCTGEIGKYLGEEAQTPEGQCIGKHTLRFAVYPYSEDHVSANVANEASAFVSPVYAAYQHHDYNVFVGGRPFVQASDIPVSFTRPLEAPKVKVPLEYTSFKVKESVTGAMVLSAFKAAQDGDGYVVRFYNCSEKADDVNIAFGFKIKSASLTDLAENEKQTLAVLKGNKIEFRAEAKQIVTIKVKGI